MTEKRGGGKALLLEQGETERDDSRVAIVDDPIDGDRGVSKLKFSLNIVLWKGSEVRRGSGATLIKSSRSATHVTETRRAAASIKNAKTLPWFEHTRRRL